MSRQSIALLILTVLAACAGCGPGGSIPSEDAEVPRFLGGPARARPIDAAAAPRHPFLAAPGLNGMHSDSFMSDTYAWGGPLGRSPLVSSHRFHRYVGNCVSAAFDRRGRMISTCVTPFGVTLVARDPETLEILASKKITTWLPIGQKFSGGVYFHLDQRDRVLLASGKSRIELWALQEDAAGLTWQREQAIDLAPALDAVEPGKHAIVDVMPDWEGHYWFITRAGLFGVAERDGGSVRVEALAGEGFDNALAVGPEGVFAVSDHAMYGFERDEQGWPRILWREAYDRGSAPKPGTMGHGSGTTPTLVGDDYVAVTDNADGQIHVLVYQRAGNIRGERLVCAEPVLPADRGTTENSLAAVGRSLIVENNFGYRGPFSDIDAEPGVVRVDIAPDGSGCRVVWENLEVSSPSAVPKASLANGLIYVYTRDPANPPELHAWYLTALDFRTGRVVYKVLTGVGAGYNNHYGAITLAPDGKAYVGTLQGVVAVADRAPGDALGE